MLLLISHHREEEELLNEFVRFFMDWAAWATGEHYDHKLLNLVSCCEWEKIVTSVVLPATT